MASAMPVLPLVGSMMIRGVPRTSSPRASASSSMASAIRSLTLPEGLAPSSLAHRRTLGSGLNVGSSTSGVLPMACSIDVAGRVASRTMGSAACHRRQDGDHVALGDRRLQALQVPHVLVVDVDVDELALLATRLQQLGCDAGVALLQVLDQRPQRGALGRDDALTTDSRSQHGRYTNVRHSSAQGRHGRAAERLVVDQLVDSRIVAAQWAIRVAWDAHLTELHAQAVEQQQPIGQWLAQVEDQLDRLDRLDRADDAAHRTQDTCLGAAGHGAWRRWCGEQAAIAALAW